jgi:hypothetical protein
MDNHVITAPAKAPKPRQPRQPLDFKSMPPEALLRAGDFLRPGPVPLGKTAWHELVAAGKAPPPVMRRPRLTLWAWRDVRSFLETFTD